MALFSADTVPNQTLMLVSMEQMRGLTGEFSRWLDKLASFQVQYTNTVAARFTALDAGLLIPDVFGVPTATAVERRTGLAGAVPLTREEVITMCGTNFANLLTTYDTAAARALYVKMVGPLNAVPG